MACKTYVNDLSSIAEPQSLAKESTHQVETNMGYLCLKDDTRKRYTISQTPGEWNVSITLSIEGVGLFVTVS